MTELQTFFDGGCPLCSREIAYYRKIDRDHRIQWIDITQEADALAKAGLDLPSAMRRLHVRDSEGRVLSGVEAFIAIWQRLPRWHLLAKLVTGLRLTRPLEWGYRHFAERRFQRRCAEGACALD
ncbi:thiol-disulfide oxidoreductase DCC family protein [Halochromatium sp.]